MMTYNNPRPLVVENKKRSRTEDDCDTYERPNETLAIDDFSDEEDEDIFFSDEGNSPPRKRVKCTLALERTSFSSSIRITTSTKNCQAQFTLRNPSHLRDVHDSVKTKLFRNPEKDISFRILDFASSDSLNLYRDVTTGTFCSDVIQLRVEGHDERSRCILAYLRGLLTRKDELAIIPIEDTDYQLLLFFEDSNNNDIQTTEDVINSLCSIDVFQTSLSCLLVRRFNMIFDLDETLIRTRIPRDANDLAVNKGEHEFFVQNSRYITCVRPGVDMILRWSCQIFKVYVFTNAIREYAIEIAKILDPNREHLLANITDNAQLIELIKSREQMVPHKNIPRPQGMKVLNKFGIEPLQSVVFDDDSNVWSPKNQDCILPFDQVTASKKPSELFCQIRNETWKRLAFMQKRDYANRKKQGFVNNEKPSFSQDHILVQLETPTNDVMNVETEDIMGFDEL
jgi:hypothetical protein